MAGGQLFSPAMPAQDTLVINLVDMGITLNRAHAHATWQYNNGCVPEINCLNHAPFPEGIQ